MKTKVVNDFGLFVLPDMRKKTLLFLLFVALHSVTLAQVRVTQIEEYIQTLRQRDLAFGSLAVYQDGQVMYQGVMGYERINNDNKSATRIKTHYRIGSVSKMFTAVMIFQLIEKKKLSLDQPLSDFYPALPHATDISIAHLLNHQSGLHDYTKDTGFEVWMDTFKPQAELLEIIRARGSDFAPGTKNEYCNTNYLLLGYILEQVTGTSYEENLRKRINSRLKLKDTYIPTTGPAEGNERESISYKYTNGNWTVVKQTYPGTHAGAGAIVSTPADLSAFVQALFDGKLVRKGSLEKMQTIVNGYGSGLFPYDHGTSKGYGHNGRIEEFYTAVRYYPESKISVVYCTNGINFPRTDILESVIKSCFNESIEIPFASAHSAVFNDYTGTYEAPGMPAVSLSVQDSNLVAETQGATFVLEPVMKNYFMHAITGYYFEFTPAENSLQIKETDNVYFLKKK